MSVLGNANRQSTNAAFAQRAGSATGVGVAWTWTEPAVTVAWQCSCMKPGRRVRRIDIYFNVLRTGTQNRGIGNLAAAVM